MGVHFADYQPYAHGRAALVDVEPLAAQHVDGCVALALQRDGGEPERWRASFERSFSDPDRATFVGLVDEQLAGYATAAFLTWDEGSTAPDGWYLTGVVIALPFRRLGAGRALTAARLEWLRERADTAWYFASSANPASIDLHAPFGFALAARDVVIPGVSFTGAGLLYSVEL